MPIKYLSAVIFIAMLAVSLILAAASYFSTSVPVTDSGEVLNGEVTAQYEKEFDKNLLHRDPSIKSWNAAGYFLFGEGKEGVLIGIDGWLFTHEEFNHSEYFEKNIDENEKYIAKIAGILKQDKVNLLVVPLPSKARIYSDKLGKYQFPEYWKPQYQSLLGFLDENDISSVDMEEVFQKHKGENIFLKTDTHWTPLGARLAAMSAEYKISSKFPYLSWPLKKFKNQKAEAIDYEGDLMRYTVKGKAAEIFDLKKDHFDKWEVIDPDQSQEDLFGDINIPVVLVGTSYSANKTWNFDGFLKESLGTDVLNVADEGMGPFETMERYIQSDTYKNNKPKLVIWEMPERYLAMPFGKKEEGK